MKGGVLTSWLAPLATAAIASINGSNDKCGLADYTPKAEGVAGASSRSDDSREGTVTHIPFTSAADTPRYAEAHPFFDKILPSLDGPRPPLRFAKRHTLARRALETVFGREHKIYGALGLAANIYSMYLALAHYAMHVGMREFASQYVEYATTDKFIPVEENDFIQVARRHYLHGIRTYAKALSLDVKIEGGDKYPKDGTVFVLAANHASIFSDFLFTWMDPAAAAVAAAENFCNDPVAKWSGSALYFDLMGLPLIWRTGANGGNGDERRRVSAKSEMGKRLDSLISLHGTRPIYFGQGGRVPTAYDESGLQTRAGFYSNVPDPGKPRTYFVGGGVIVTAVRCAKRTGQDVSLAVLSLSGTERVMAKDAAGQFPFFGKARIGEEVRYSVLEVVTIRPGERRLGDISKRAVGLLKDDLEIDSYLEEVVSRWASSFGKGDLGGKFLDAAAEDEAFLIIADRIRSVHPRHSERYEYQRELIGCLEEYSLIGKVPTARLDGLLEEVSEKVRSRPAAKRHG